jgi:hypothetical protein
MTLVAEWRSCRYDRTVVSHSFQHEWILGKKYFSYWWLTWEKQLFVHTFVYCSESLGRKPFLRVSSVFQYLMASVFLWNSVDFMECWLVYRSTWRSNDNDWYNSLLETQSLNWYSSLILQSHSKRQISRAYVRCDSRPAEWKAKKCSIRSCVAKRILSCT